MLDFERQKIGSIEFGANYILVIEHMIRNRDDFIFEAIHILDNKKYEETVTSSDMSVNQEYTSREPYSYRPSYDFHNSNNEDAGVRGLENMGNTCFMNASLQCIQHTDQLLEYFLNQRHLNDINEYNKMGSGGDVAIEFGSLI